jgi:hypothetical protein
MNDCNTTAEPGYDEILVRYASNLDEEDRWSMKRK